jgi:hypothetical protein
MTIWEVRRPCCVRRAEGSCPTNTLTVSTGILLVFEKDLLVRVPWLRDFVKVMFYPQASVYVRQVRPRESGCTHSQFPRFSLLSRWDS